MNEPTYAEQTDRIRALTALLQTSQTGGITQEVSAAIKAMILIPTLIVPATVETTAPAGDTVVTGAPAAGARPGAPVEQSAAPFPTTNTPPP